MSSASSRAAGVSSAPARVSEVASLAKQLAQLKRNSSIVAAPASTATLSAAPSHPHPDSDAAQLAAAIRDAAAARRERKEGIKVPHVGEFYGPQPTVRDPKVQHTLQLQQVSREKALRAASARPTVTFKSEVSEPVNSDAVVQKLQRQLGAGWQRHLARFLRPFDVDARGRVLPAEFRQAVTLAGGVLSEPEHRALINRLIVSNDTVPSAHPQHNESNHSALLPSAMRNQVHYALLTSAEAGKVTTEAGFVKDIYHSRYQDTDVVALVRRSKRPEAPPVDEVRATDLPANPVAHSFSAPYRSQEQKALSDSVLRRQLSLSAVHDSLDTQSDHAELLPLQSPRAAEVMTWHAPPQWSEPTPDARAACQVLLNAVNQRPQRALAIFNRFDSDHDGVIRRDDFLRALVQHNIELSRHQQEQLFESFDRHRSGSVDVQEFCGYLNTLTESKHEEHRPVGQTEVPIQLPQGIPVRPFPCVAIPAVPQKQQSTSTVPSAFVEAAEAAARSAGVDQLPLTDAKAFKLLHIRAAVRASLLSKESNTSSAPTDSKLASPVQRFVRTQYNPRHAAMMRSQIDCL